MPEQCTIVIVAYNCWNYVFLCLEALLRQTVSGFHIILVDNGEADREVLARLSAYRNTTYVKRSSNVGFAAANNYGIGRAGVTEWVMLLNPDTAPAADFLEKMLTATVRFPSVSFFGARLLQAHNPALLDGDGDCYHVGGLPWRNGMGQRAAQASVAPRETFAPCAAAALYRLSALREVGGFDEDFFCYMEDVDLGFRLRLAGHRCLTVPDAKVLHIGSAITGRRSPFYIYHGQRNFVWTYVKNMPGILFWVFLPLHIALNVGGVVRCGLRGQLVAVWRAKRDAIKGLPEMWRKRKAIQAQRVVSTWDILRALSWR